jgi:hypothetical protein
MIELNELEPLYDKIPLESDSALKDELFAIFKADFIDNQFYVDGKKVKIIYQKSNMPGFRQYPETFVHIVTRESHISGKRNFEPNRANRIHWIKNILLQSNDSRIKFFQYRDEKGVLKDHYWYEDYNFMVVLKPLSPDTLIVTAFCVDQLEKPTYKRRLNEYRKGLK